MKNRALRVGRAACALVILGATTFAFTPVSSADPVPITCDVYNPNGLILTDNGDGTFDWALQGSGTCSGGFPENFNVSFTGSGTSQGNGLCTEERTAVALTIDAQFTNSSTTIHQNLRWNVLVSPGVITIPFIVSGDSTGAGDMFTRIFAKCSGSGGTNAARFIWTQQI